MAKVVIEVDTEQKGIAVSIDGVAVTGSPTYVSVSEYEYEEKPYISIEIPTKLDNGLQTTLRYSSCAKDIQRTAASIIDTTTLKGFVGVNKVSDDIAKYLTR